MKKIYLMHIIVLFFIIGCSNTQIKHLNATSFINQAQEIEQMNSAYKTSYIGKTDSRIYLEYYTGVTSTGKGKTIIYWTELENLSDDQLKIIGNKSEEPI